MKTLRQRQLETGRTLALNGVAWRRLREVILSRDPLCVCGCGAPSTDVDHRDNDPANNELDNLQGMAAACHSRKTQADMGKRIKFGCDANGLPLGNHFWNEKSPAVETPEPPPPPSFNANRNDE